MSVVITEISVFLFFAALVGFVTGRFTRSRPREAGSAGEAQARLHQRADSADQKALRKQLIDTEEALAEATAEVTAARDALAQLESAHTELARTAAELESNQAAAQGRLGTSTAGADSLDRSREARNDLRDQLLKAQHELVEAKASLAAARVDLRRTRTAAPQEGDDDGDLLPAEAAPTASGLEDDTLHHTDARELDTNALALAQAQVRAERDNLRGERDALAAQAQTREDDARNLREALEDARARLARMTAEHAQLRDAAERPPAAAPLPHSRNPLSVRFASVSEPVGRDAREARVQLIIDMAPGTPWALRAKRVRVTLEYDLDAANIAINGRRTGPLTLVEEGELRPDRPMAIELRVSTGAFSASLSQHRESTLVGDHPVRVNVQFQLEPVGGRAGRAIARLVMPVVAT